MLETAAAFVTVTTAMRELSKLVDRLKTELSPGDKEAEKLIETAQKALTELATSAAQIQAETTQLRAENDELLRKQALLESFELVSFGKSFWVYRPKPDTDEPKGISLCTNCLDGDGIRSVLQGSDELKCPRCKLTIGSRTMGVVSRRIRS